MAERGHALLPLGEGGRVGERVLLRELQRRAVTPTQKRPIGSSTPVDGSVVRAHQHAAGAQKGGPSTPTRRLLQAGTAQDSEALGRSRGGFTTEIHLRAEGGGKPIAILLTAAGQQTNEHRAPFWRPDGDRSGKASGTGTTQDTSRAGGGG